VTAFEPNLVKTIKNRLDVAFLPSLVQPETLFGRTVIVTDVLRATTTIVNSLFNGCAQVLPQPTLEAARLTHLQVENSLLGGERGGKIVEGFHHGNSPIEYTRELIEGKSLVLATTNGTVAMEHCRGAKRVLIGAMVNLEALVSLIGHEEEVTIVCSGTDGFVTSEDVIFAGALIERLIDRMDHHQTNGSRERPAPGPASDMATIALNHWQSTRRQVEEGKELAEFFRTARGGINLVRIGRDEDIVFAAQIDTVPVVPELDVASWSIRLPAE
jgi:2-phosphosulfolactate phosphatase